MATVAMTFVSKLYEVMSIEEYVHIIAWDTSGKHIYILDQEGFVQEILPLLTDGAKVMGSFVRQMNMYVILYGLCIN